MPEWLIVILIVVGLIGVVAFILLKLVKGDEKRASELEGYAREIGFSFEAHEDPAVIQNKFDALPIFKIGTNYLLENLMSGDVNGHEVWIGDYLFWSEKKVRRGGMDRTMETSERKYQTVICTVLAKQIPSFDITLRSGLFNYSSYSGDNEVEIDVADDFKKRYVVKAKSISDTLTIQKLLSKDIPLLFSWKENLKLEISGNQLMLTNYSLKIPAKEIHKFVSGAVAIAQGL